MDLPTEEGYVYGQAPKKPNAVPDIQALFDAADIPKGKLGDLPMPKDWYKGAKERKAQRDIEMVELFNRKDLLRREWVDLTVNDLVAWGGQVDARLGEKGPVLGLAELLARTAIERPHDEKRVEDLQEKSAKAFAEQARLREALARARERITVNEDAIRRREEEDRQKERERVAEKEAEEERRRKGEKLLARQAALLRGEEIPPSDDEDSGEKEDEAVEKQGEIAVGEQLANPTAPTPSGAPAFLAAQPASPAPELRGGLGRQLPPLEGVPAVSTGVPQTNP